MTEQRCAMCGTPVIAQARHCHRCGVSLDVVVVDVAFEERSTDAAQPTIGGNHRRRRRTLVGLVAVALALTGVVLVSSRDRDRDRDRDPTIDLAVPRVATPSAEPDDPAIVGSPAPSTTAEAADPINPAVVPTGALEPIDPATIPDLAATHLAVASATDLHFLDLVTGTWTTTSVATGSGLLRTMRAAVLVDPGDGRTRYVRVDGSEPVPLGDAGAVLGGAGDRLVYGDFRGNGRIEVSARAVDGSQFWRALLPEGFGQVFVTTGGEVVFQAAERVAAVGLDDGSIRPLASGILVGVVGDVALVRSCDEELRCTTDQIRVASGDRAFVTADAGQFVAAGTDRAEFYSSFGDGLVNYRMVDGVLEPVATGDPSRVAGPGEVAVDAVGIAARVEGSLIVFRDSDDQVLASIPAPFVSDQSPFVGTLPEARMVFVDASDRTGDG